MQILQILGPVVALLAGGLIGLAFGRLQDAAQRRNQRLEQSGRLKSGWAVMPGSGARVAYFMVALVLIQLVCPLLFVNGTQWWVSGGVAAGYGYMLYTQLRQRIGAGK